MKLPLQLDEIQAQLEHRSWRPGALPRALAKGSSGNPRRTGAGRSESSLAHLNTFGEGYAAQLKPALQKAQSEEHGEALGPFQLGFFGSFVVRAVAPETKLKLKAPQRFQPAPQKNVTARFLALQGDLLALTQQAEGLKLDRVVISSPASRFLRLSVFEALNAVTFHQLRHLQQASRVKQGLAA